MTRHDRETKKRSAFSAKNSNKTKCEQPPHGARSYLPDRWGDNISCCGKSWDTMTQSRKQQRKRCPSLNQLISGQTCRSQSADSCYHSRTNFDPQLGFNWHPAANQNPDFSHQRSPSSSDTHTSAGTCQTAYCCYKRDDLWRNKAAKQHFHCPWTAAEPHSSADQANGFKSAND